MTAQDRDLPEPGDGGFTLIELMVVAAILMIMILVLFGALDSVTASERRQQAKAVNQESVRLAAIEIGQDLRAANPIISLPTVEDYDNEVVVALGPQDGDQEYVRWRHMESGGVGVLVRQTLDAPDGSVLTSRTFLAGIIDNLDVGVPLFSYYDEHERLLNEIEDVSDDFASCTIRIRVTVTNVEDDAASEFSETFDVHLRNRLPGGEYGCTELS